MINEIEWMKPSDITTGKPGTAHQSIFIDLKDRHRGLGRDSWLLHVNAYP